MGKLLYRLGQFIWAWTPMGFEIAIQTDILETLEKIEKKYNKKHYQENKDK